MAIITVSEKKSTKEWIIVLKHYTLLLKIEGIFYIGSDQILNNHCYIRFATFNLYESQFIAAYS